MLSWPEQVCTTSFVNDSQSLTVFSVLNASTSVSLSWYMGLSQPTRSSSTLAETSPVIVRGLKDLGAYAISTRSKVIEEYMHS